MASAVGVALFLVAVVVSGGLSQEYNDQVHTDQGNVGIYGGRGHVNNVHGDDQHLNNGYQGNSFSSGSFNGNTDTNGIRSRVHGRNTNGIVRPTRNLGTSYRNVDNSFHGNNGVVNDRIVGNLRKNPSDIVGNFGEQSGAVNRFEGQGNNFHGNAGHFAGKNTGRYGNINGIASKNTNFHGQQQHFNRGSFAGARNSPYQGQNGGNQFIVGQNGPIGSQLNHGITNGVIGGAMGRDVHTGINNGINNAFKSELGGNYNDGLKGGRFVDNGQGHVAGSINNRIHGGLNGQKLNTLQGPMHFANAGHGTIGRTQFNNGHESFVNLGVAKGNSFNDNKFGGPAFTDNKGLNSNKGFGTYSSDVFGSDFDNNNINKNNVITGTGVHGNNHVAHNGIPGNNGIVGTGVHGNGNFVHNGVHSNNGIVGNSQYGNNKIVGNSFHGNNGIHGDSGIYGNSDIHSNNGIHGNSGIHSNSGVHGNVINNDIYGNNNIHGNNDIHRNNGVSNSFHGNNDVIGTGAHGDFGVIRNGVSKNSGGAFNSGKIGFSRNSFVQPVQKSIRPAHGGVVGTGVQGRSYQGNSGLGQTNTAYNNNNNKFHGAENLFKDY